MKGDYDRGFADYAEAIRLDPRQPGIARLGLAVRAIKQKQYPIAYRELTQSIPASDTGIAAILLSAWTLASSTDAKAAINTIDSSPGADYAVFKELHAGLILDLAHQEEEARKRFERAYRLDPTALRVVQGYGSLLSRHGNNGGALKIFADFNE